MTTASLLSRCSLPPLQLVLSWACLTFAPWLQAEAPFLRDGEAGFVVSYIEFALAEDADKSGACPSGLATSLSDQFAMTAEGKRRLGESEKAYLGRQRQGVKQLSSGPGGEDLCMHPEAGEPDPYFRTVEINDIPVYGIDLDGQSSSSDVAAPGSCPHNDFAGMNGEKGVDNQFYRVVGCSPSYQSTGPSNTFNTAMLTGAWGILIHLKGIDDIGNDEQVEVGIYANADPIQLSPGREPLAYASYSAEHNPRYRARTIGQITAGVLTTEPVDIRLHGDVNSMILERVLRDARLQLTISKDREIGGYLGGYAPVEDIYDLKFGFRNGKTSSGDLAPLRLRSGSANGAAFVLGHTCKGVYHALYEYADGHPDRASGRCTSISNQYRINALPAFILDGLDWQPQEQNEMAEAGK